MEPVVYSTPADGRICKRAIQALLKSWLVHRIKRIQYVKDYMLDNISETTDTKQKKSSIIQQEEKILIMRYDEEKKEKIHALLQKTLWTFEQMSNGWFGQV